MNTRSGLPGSCLASDGRAGEVGVRLDLGVDSVGPLDQVVHRGRQPQATGIGGVDHHGAQVVPGGVLGAKRRRQHGGRAGIVAAARERLVGDQLGLEDDPRRAAERLDLVT